MSQKAEKVVRERIVRWQRKVSNHTISLVFVSSGKRWTFEVISDRSGLKEVITKTNSLTVALNTYNRDEDTENPVE